MMMTMRLLALAGILGAAAVPAQAGNSPMLGTWINPHHSVAVRTSPCGDALCGWVVWANEEAKGDARAAGVASLVGTQLLSDYRATGPNHYAGTVFVPDHARHFASSLSLLGPGQLQIKGCILGGLICRSQVWHRAA